VVEVEFCDAADSAETKIIARDKEHTRRTKNISRLVKQTRAIDVVSLCRLKQQIKLPTFLIGNHAVQGSTGNVEYLKRNAQPSCITQ